MKIQFIPVIELGYYNQNVPAPEQKPGLRYSAEWEQYRIECLRRAGCPDILSPYFKGTDFYRLNEIPSSSLNWLIYGHIADYLQGQYGFDQLCPFFGGYALLQDGECLLYPQCCGDLSDIIFWKYICKRREQRYYNGHPSPLVSFVDDMVCFNCIDEYEVFDPETKEYFEVNHKALLEAYSAVLPELATFYRQVLNALNQMPLLESPTRIADRLIYENVDLSDDEV